MDISDGLIGDLQHICDASRVGATIEVGRLPLSNAGRKAVASAPTWLDTVIGGGDDYELLFTASSANEDALTSLGRDVGVPVTRVGRINEGRKVRVVGLEGHAIIPTKIGYRHF